MNRKKSQPTSRKIPIHLTVSAHSVTKLSYALVFFKNKNTLIYNQSEHLMTILKIQLAISQPVGFQFQQIRLCPSLIKSISYATNSCRYKLI